MIDYKEVYKHLRILMMDSFDDPDIRVIQLKSNGITPKGVYGTVDILTTTDSSGYTTNKWLDPVTEELVYETYKDILISVSVRNSDYRNLDAQDRVGYLANSFHKSLTYDHVLNYLDSELGATVKSTQPLRELPNYTPTGINQATMFNFVISMVDVSRVKSTAITNVNLDVSISNP